MVSGSRFRACASQHLPRVALLLKPVHGVSVLQLLVAEPKQGGVVYPVHWMLLVLAMSSLSIGLRVLVRVEVLPYCIASTGEINTWALEQ